MKQFFFSAALLFLTAVFTGCGENTETPKAGTSVKIGVSIPAASHGWSGGVVWHAEREAEKLRSENKNVQVKLTTAANAAEQVDRIENLIADGVDALVVLAQEPEPLTAICAQAKKQGIYLVVVSNPLAENIQDVFVQGSNTGFGEASAEAIGTLLEGKGDILVMEGIPCPINTERVEAFRKVLAEKYPGIKILDSRAAYWNTEKGMNLMENYLQKYKKIDAVWTGDDDVLKGAVTAYRESGRTDIKVMTGGGGCKDIVKLIKDNDPLVRATVTYPPQMAAEGIRAALDGLKNGKKVPEGKKVIQVKSEIILHDNAEKFYFPDSVY